MDESPQRAMSHLSKLMKCGAPGRAHDGTTFAQLVSVAWKSSEQLAPSFRPSEPESSDKPSGTRRVAPDYRDSRGTFITRSSSPGLPDLEPVLRVLLVEDNDGDFELAREAFQSSPGAYSIVRARSLKEAADVVRMGQVDFIFADLGLPDATGVEVVESLVAIAPRVPTVVLSGREEFSVALEAVQCGAQDFLTKESMSGDSLHRTVRYSIERKRYESQIDFLFHHDQLTGLANRRFFRDRLARSLETSETETAVLLIDLDRWKSMNEGFGTEVADQILVQVADRIVATLQKAEAIPKWTHGSGEVARLGGDDFGVIVDGPKNPGQLSSLAEQLKEAISQPYPIDDESHVCTASIGVAMTPQDGQKPDRLIKSAERALSIAKTFGGHSSAFVDRKRNEDARENLRIENELRRALDAEQFELFYQPQVSTVDGSIVGVEALLRWRRNNQNYSSPAQFIPVLEETGLITDVGDWVLKEACRVLSESPEEELRRVSVNVSARQFQSGRLVRCVKQVLGDSGVAPHRLELELTETLLLDDTGEAKRVIVALRDMGVRIALDDFGTGYSSLSYIRDFPMDVLKIDGDFVTNIETSSRQSRLTASIIEMGHALEMEVVAERVETDGQLKILREHGCDVVQGYLTGRPEPRK